MHATRPINWSAPSGATFTDEIDHHLARARRIRADALRRAGRRAGRTLRGLRRTVRSRLDRWAAARSLALLSDRTLADIGIPRHAIPLVARGLERPAEEAGPPVAVQSRAGVVQRIELWRERQNRRRRIERELQAYNDRDLEELGVFRADIPRLARAAA